MIRDHHTDPLDEPQRPEAGPHRGTVALRPLTRVPARLTNCYVTACRRFQIRRPRDRSPIGWQVFSLGPNYLDGKHRPVAAWLEHNGLTDVSFSRLTDLLASLEAHLAVMPCSPPSRIRWQHPEPDVHVGGDWQITRSDDTPPAWRVTYQGQHWAVLSTLRAAKAEVDQANQYRDH